MGLDMYAYKTSKVVEDKKEITDDNREELAYWRKHNRLHGWMEELWEDKGRPNFTNSESQPMGDFKQKAYDLGFVEKAKKIAKKGECVYYTCWW